MAASDTYVHGLYADASCRPGPRSAISRTATLHIFNTYVLLGDAIAVAAAILITELLPLHNRLVLGASILHSQLVLSGLGGALAAILLRRGTDDCPSDSSTRIRLTENVLRASAASLLFLWLLDVGLQLNAIHPSSAIAIVLVPALLGLHRHTALRIKTTFRIDGLGAIPVVVYVDAGGDLNLDRIHGQLESHGLRAVAQMQGEINDLANISSESSDQSSVRIESIDSQLLCQTHCELFVVAAGPTLVSHTLDQLITTGREAGVPVAFLSSSGDLLIDSDLGVGKHILHAKDHFFREVSDAWWRRSFDIVMSASLFVLISPLLLLISAAIRLDSAGPALFLQERVGKGGPRFRIVKFRTLFISAAPYERSPIRSTDPRITRVGRILRRLSLDELPQLANVLLGDMSLVGPRPEMPFLVDRHISLHRQRLMVKPGITGLWQLSPDRTRPIHENIRHDLCYIRNRNAFLDLAILLHTLVRAGSGGV